MSADVHPLSASLRGGESGANYEILGKLATGGMAELFLARAPNTSGRPGPVVVLKRILPHLAEDPEFIRMFRDEAYLAATLRHPNIVQVFDIGKRGEDYFFTMEYVHGENLRAILRSAQKRGESIPLTHILTIALGITAALHHAHEQTDEQGRPLHIVHRDVSPTNVLVAYDGSVKIVDFGIAKAAAGTHVTQAGMLKGKASYMSPEQCRAGQVDRRSDVFAIGILLYEMTTLTRLFKGDNELAILHQVLSGAVDPPSQRRPGYPPELERIILRALANEPDNRYSTAEELQADLMRFGQQNNLRPSNPALGQFLRGLFGNRPLPWADNPAVESPNPPNNPANGLRGAPPSPPPRGGPPQPPQPPSSMQPGRGGGPRPARGPGSRAPAAKAWRPGGRGNAPPPPPSSLPAPPVGPTTAKQVRLGQPSHPSSRATAPRSAPIPRPNPPRPGGPPRPAPARPSAASYAPPPPDYDIDPEESKTAIATPRPDFAAYGLSMGEGDGAQEEAKTRVSGTSASDVAAFMAAAPAADLAVEDVATQVASKPTADAVAAFLAAAPPADLVGEEPSPMMVRTQIAPATAAEIQALADAAAKAGLKPSAQDLFSAPSAPTRPGGKPAGPAQGAPPQASPGHSPRPNLPAPSDLPPPGGRASQPQARPAVPSPSDLPPPGGRAAGAPGGTLAPPSGSNRRDTIMNAPAQPAALGGPSRTAPPSNNPLLSPVDTDLDDLATVRMSVDHALHVSGRTPMNEANRTVAMNPPTAAELGLSPPHQHTIHQQQQQQQQQHYQPYPPQGQHPLGPPQAPLQHWQHAPQQHMPSGHTVPMPMVDLEDDPLVVPGRNAKLIAMVVTVVVGLGLGATGVWLFLLD